jgi:hypothetical protein
VEDKSLDHEKPVTHPLGGSKRGKGNLLEQSESQRL